MTPKALALATVAFGLLATPVFAETVHFQGTLSPGAEVPPKTTDGKGTCAATLDTTDHKLNYDITYSGLTGAATAAHFHGPAESGKNAGIVVPLSPPTSPIKGTATLTDAQQADLMAGKWYANVHTAANPQGEIRCQMTKS
jgi:hypothetical protein